MFVVADIKAQPGDVFTFPTSIEVGVFEAPEPSSLALAGICFGGVIFHRRRRR